MAFLKPDKIYTLHGLEIKEKLITKSSGVKYYSNTKLNTKDHKPEHITIHNTADIQEAAGTNDAEQYSRATFNNAMNDVVVHYYLDETDCWHILADDTIGYHATDGKTGPGNSKSIAIEIIMDGSGKSYDTQAEDRGALLAAILLEKYGLTIDKMVPHQHWYKAKTCPYYILPHWNKFVSKVKANLEKFEKEKKDTEKKKPETSDYIYVVQIGAFSVKANADAYVKKAEKAGFNVIVEKRKKESGYIYVVQIGAFSVKANADAYVKKAEKAGFNAIIEKKKK